MKILLLPAIIQGLFVTSLCGQMRDSAQQKSASSNARLTVRLHSLGQFSYGGRLVSDNPVGDLNFTYDRKAWGFQLFKAVDLRDSHTPFNFTLAVLNKNFRFGRRLTVTPMAGFI